MGEKHTKLICSGEGVAHPVLLFGTPRNLLDVFPGDRIDLLFELSVNEFRGSTTLQLICRSCRPSAGQMQVATAEQQRMERLMSGDLSVLTPADLPTREECGRIYRILRGRLGYGRGDLVSPRHLMEDADGYLRQRLALALLSDAGLLTLRGDGPYTVTVPKTDRRTDLTALPLWKQLHSLF
jgi:hypothetical protein